MYFVFFLFYFFYFNRMYHLGLESASQNVFFYFIFFFYFNRIHHLGLESEIVSIFLDIHTLFIIYLLHTTDERYLRKSLKNYERNRGSYIFTVHLNRIVSGPHSQYKTMKKIPKVFTLRSRESFPPGWFSLYTTFTM